MGVCDGNAVVCAFRAWENVRAGALLERWPEEEKVYPVPIPGACELTVVWVLRAPDVGDSQSNRPCQYFSSSFYRLRCERGTVMSST